MAPTFPWTAKSAIVAVCLANYMAIPFDAQIMKDIIELNWISLVAYVGIEQLFLATFRRLDFRLVGYISMAVAVAQIWMQRDQTAFLATEQKGLLLPTVVDAANNVAILVLAINLSSPARANILLLEYTSIFLIALGYSWLKLVPLVEFPIKAVFSTGTWEQLRLLSSFLFLRIAAGGLLQAVVLTISKDSELRIGILRSNYNLDLDEPNHDAKDKIKPKPNFAMNVNISLILAGAAVTVVVGVLGGVFAVLVTTRDAFAA